MNENKYLQFILLVLVFALAYLFISENRQQKQLAQIMDVIVSLEGVMHEQDTRADIVALDTALGDLEERITGERKVLEDRLAEERKQRELVSAEATLAKLNSELKIAELQNNIDAASAGSFDLASIVLEWEPRVVQVTCNFSRGAQTGSGLMLSIDGRVSVLTNKHVVLDIFGRAPVSCSSRLPSGKTYTSLTATEEIEVAVDSLDFAVLFIDNVDAEAISLVGPALSTCSVGAPTGDQVLILGYPSIGSASSITATEGIISGYEDDFYITSAKVERGNSGGVAVHLRNNCYLGIPTFVQTGAIESLARILDVRTIGLE